MLFCLSTIFDVKCLARGKEEGRGSVGVRQNELENNEISR